MFQFFRNCELIKGGGVGAYIQESIKFKHRKDIEDLQPDLEHLWIEIPGHNKHNKTLIGVMYRSTRILTNSDWLEHFESLLGYLTVNWNGLLVLLGDINIDLLQPSNNLTKQYQSILDVFGIQQMVNQPTRVTRTLIDHIVTNYPQNITHTGIIPCSIICDHDAVFACINTRVVRFQPRYKYIRIDKNFDENAFREDFSSVPLNIVYGLDSPDDMVHAMNTLMRECINCHAPLRRIKVTLPPAPWLKSDEICKLQSERDVLRVRARKHKIEETWTAFRTIRNKIKSMISKAKRSFLVNALSSKRSKEMWKIIHRVLHPNLKSLRADPN